MINARAHSISDIQTWTLNLNFKRTYESFLKFLITQRDLSLSQKMTMIYYMQLQERINEAINLFKTIDFSSLMSDVDDETLKIQYDYMNAYFDFFTG
jgi:hypothetical protein